MSSDKLIVSVLSLKTYTDLTIARNAIQNLLDPFAPDPPLLKEIKNQLLSIEKISRNANRQVKRKPKRKRKSAKA